MTREELIKKVALKMDEISSSDDVIVPVNAGDNNPLYTQINNLLNESVNDALMKAPVYRIQNQIETVSNATSKSLFGDTRRAAVFAVPNDFIRLVQINDDLFQRPITELAIEGDDVDKRQHNRHLVAKYAKPVAVMGRGADGRTITCYSYDAKNNEGEDINLSPSTSMLYIKRYESDKDTTKDTGLDDYMIDLVSWVCAGRVFAAQGDINKGKICDDNAAALMI
jgi:hypothetical protein